MVYADIFFSLYIHRSSVQIPNTSDISHAACLLPYGNIQEYFKPYGFDLKADY